MELLVNVPLTLTNCEKIAANQIRILGLRIDIEKPCINEFIFFCLSSIIISLDFCIINCI